MKIFFEIGFFLMQFDSLPYLFKYSVYRPYFSIIFFFIYLSLSLLKSKKIILDKQIVWITIILILLNTVSFYKNYQFYNDTKGFTKMFISSGLGLVTLLSSYVYFNQFSDNKKKVLKLGKLSYYSLFFPIVLGIFQLGYVFNIFSNSFNKNLFLLFSYRNLFNRVQFGGGEPSSGVRLIFSAFIVSRLYKESLPFKMIVILLLIFTYSTYGYIYMFLVLVLYTLLREEIKIIKGLKIFFKLISIILGMYILLILFHKYLPNYYMKKKIEVVFSFSNIDLFLEKTKIDGSAFQRIINPIIGIIMGLKNPIFGVGSEYYYKNYREIVEQYFNYGLNHNSVMLAEVNGITPKNFFVKIFAENGFILLVWFVYFLKNLLDKIKRIDIEKEKKEILYIVLSIIIMNWFTGQDSWMFINNIVYISFLLALKLKKGDKTRNEKY